MWIVKYSRPKGQPHVVGWLMYPPRRAYTEDLGPFPDQSEAMLGISKHLANETCLRLGVVKHVAFCSAAVSPKLFRRGVTTELISWIQGRLERYEMRKVEGKPLGVSVSNTEAQGRFPFISPEE